MIVELGHFATILALGIAAGLAVVGYLSATRRNWARTATVLASAQLLAVASGFAALLYAFLTSDFSVLYVTENSNTALPWYYKLSAAWGGHEGSFLLWTLMLAAWTSAVSIAGRRVPPEIHGRVLGTLGLLNAGFLLFLLSVSSPFERLIGGPAEGSDLNPLLQDFGQIVHPPMLYLGYVGFAVAFAFAVAALLAGRLDAVWARWTRPWANVAWAFLTVGIALGSWWAYYELGWGGWWFWDPVENASFMPWLAGTALIHSLAVTEKRGAFKSWTVFLAIAAFSLSLLGAFIVRSGVLTSVHAFAVDPERGLYLLAFVVLAVGGALTLYGLRAPAIRARAHYWGLSRELMLLCNNLVLVLALAVILIYTLYPLAYEAVTAGEKTSIGPPYYNRVFVPLALALAAVLAVMPVSRWRRTPVVLFRNIGVMLVVAVAFGVLLPLVLGGAIAIGAMLAVGLGLWIAMTHVTDFRRRRRSLTRSYVGMVIAHLGFAVSVVGVGVTSEFSHAVDARMTIGDSVALNDVEYRLNRVERVEGPNYTADRVEFTTDTGVVLYPEKRHYRARNQVMTEAGIAPGFLGDLYITLGEQLPDGSWGVRINDKPLVRWVWLGALMMAFGGVLAVTDARYRRLSRRQSLPSRAVPGEPAVT
ncbi:MAG: heme lyase CcmF/NrfE family subunit [Gammaproteobacteria bacterium]|nr:heme lyase CcmF/NrfE family subunit [Gammaproteobacteria bacterium]